MYLFLHSTNFHFPACYGLFECFPYMLLCALRPAAKLLLLSSCISWRPIITGSWWRGCTYTASSSWPSSLTRTTCGPSPSSAGVNCTGPQILCCHTHRANGELTDTQFPNGRCPGCVCVHLGQCSSIAGRHTVSHVTCSNVLCSHVSQILT